MLKKYVILLFFLIPASIYAQQSLDYEVEDFDRVIISPHIDVVLLEGNSPHVRVEYENIDVHEINVDRSGKTLKLFLSQARIFEKTERTDYNYTRGVYHDARVTAFVTFTALEMLEVRGDQHVNIGTPVRSKEFKLKAYGENIITLAAVNSEYLKVSLFGENELRIEDGQVEFQKYTLYGENAIEAGNLTSQHTQTTIYGESEILVHADHELKVTALGEGIISYTGNPVINTGLIIGEPRIFARQ
ncbi:MAG: DUF2807 domain-containing protein [Cyclobacteriaceae bacterium]